MVLSGVSQLRPDIRGGGRGGDGKEKDTDPDNANSTSDPSGYVYEAVPGNRL